MHETSIAIALLGQVRRHTPAGMRASEVKIEAGPMQGIDPEAMRWAWQSVTVGTELEGATLELQALPWQVSCPRCGARWSCDDPFAPCTCGNPDTQPAGSSDLRLLALEVLPLPVGQTFA